MFFIWLTKKKICFSFVFIYTIIIFYHLQLETVNSKKLRLYLFSSVFDFSLSFIFPGKQSEKHTSKVDPSTKTHRVIQSVYSDMSLVNGRALTSLLAALTMIAMVVVDVDARFVVEKESIRVLSPEEMRSKHDGSIANFGLPDYGGFLIGAVVYPDSKTDGCSAFGKTFNPKFPRPTILLLDRGGKQHNNNNNKKTY